MGLFKSFQLIYWTPVSGSYLLVGSNLKEMWKMAGYEKNVYFCAGFWVSVEGTSLSHIGLQ